MEEFHVLVAGVPYGYQGDWSDGRWLTSAHRAQIEAISPTIRLSDPPVQDLNNGWTPRDAPRALLLETSGAEPTWDDLPGVLLGKALPRLIGERTVFLQSCSAGVEHLAPLMPGTLPVCNASGVHSNAIAETVMGSILAREKLLYVRRADQAAQRWRQLPCRELTGMVVCILGTGHIGAAVARLSKTFGMATVGVRRSGGVAEHFDQVVTRERLHDVLPYADYLVVACPLTDETRGLVGTEEFKRLKRDAYLANVARGAIVDEGAMIAALEEGSLGGAFLDCLAQEPLPPDHPLWTIPGVDVSPHDSHASQLLGDHHVDLFCRNLERALGDSPLLNVVDFTRGY